MSGRIYVGEGRGRTSGVVQQMLYKCLAFLHLAVVSGVHEGFVTTCLPFGHGLGQNRVQERADNAHGLLDVIAPKFSQRPRRAELTSFYSDELRAAQSRGKLGGLGLAAGRFSGRHVKRVGEAG
jgi:hypothetical protein